MKDQVVVSGVVSLVSFFQPKAATTSTTIKRISQTESSTSTITSTTIATTISTTNSTTKIVLTTTEITPTHFVKTNTIVTSANEITTSAALTTLPTKATTSKTSAVKIWAPIVAVAGLIIICSLVLFGVRYSRIKAGVDKENQPGYEVPYEETKYETPYRYSDKNETRNDIENLENEEIYEVYHSDRGSIEYEPYEHAEYAEYKIENEK